MEMFLCGHCAMMECSDLLVKTLMVDQAEEYWSDSVDPSISKTAILSEMFTYNCPSCHSPFVFLKEIANKNNNEDYDVKREMNIDWASDLKETAQQSSCKAKRPPFVPTFVECESCGSEFETKVQGSKRCSECLHKMIKEAEEANKNGK